MPARISIRRVAKTPLSVEALWAMRRIGAPTLSPDGRSLRGGHELRHGKQQRYDGAVAVPDRPRERPASKARRLTAGDKDSEPRWSPDGRCIAFTAKRKDDAEPQIYLIAPDGGEARAAHRHRDRRGGDQVVSRRQAHRVRVLGVAGSRNRRGAGQAHEGAQGRQGQGARDRARRVPLLGPLARRRARAARVRLRRRDAVAARDVLAGAGCALQPWDPARRAITTSRPTAARSRSRSIPAPEPRDDGSVRHRRREPANRPRAEPDVGERHVGRAPALFAGRPLPRLPCVRHPARVQRSGTSARSRARRPAPATRSRRASTARRPACRVGARLARRCCSLIEDRGRVGLWRLRSTPTRRRCSSRRRHDRRLRAVARRQRARVRRERQRCIRRRFSRPAATAAASARSNRSIDALLARHALGDVREFTVKGWRGEPVQMFVTYPPNFDPPRKWPLMHSIHGGPHAAHHDGWHFRWNTQVFAGQGYVVARSTITARRVSARSSSRRSPAATARRSSPTSRPATDFLLRQGYIDRARLVATGGSYGGFMVAYMNGHTDRYRAYVCHAGCYDWVSMMATDGYRFFAHELGAFHWDDEARVMRQSPHHYVARAKTPTLVDPRRARLPRSGDAGAPVLQRAEGEGRAGAARLFSRREPLDPEAAELAALVSRVLRLDRALRQGRAERGGGEALRGAYRADRRGGRRLRPPPGSSRNGSPPGRQRAGRGNRTPQSAHSP